MAGVSWVSRPSSLRESQEVDRFNPVNRVGGVESWNLSRKDVVAKNVPNSCDGESEFIGVVDRGCLPYNAKQSG